MTPVAGDLLARRAQRSPESIALIDAESGARWSYAALDTAVEILAGRIHALDIDGNDRIGVYLEDRPVAIGVVHALARCGAVAVPLSPRWARPRLAAAVKQADPVAVICGADTVADATAAIDRTLVTVDDGDQVPPLPAPTAFDPTGRTAAEVQLAAFTSGTTGSPKLVELTAGNLRASAVASAFRLGVTPSDRWYSPLAPWHIGGLSPAIRTALYGTTAVHADGFDTGRTLVHLAGYECTGTSIVPTMLRRLLEAEPSGPTVERTVGTGTPAADFHEAADGRAPLAGPVEETANSILSSLRTVLVGGARTPVPLVRRSLVADIPIHPTYGLTEAASQVATATPAMVDADPNTVGPPLFDTDITIVDAEGTPVPEGEPGEIVIDGPTVTPGYDDPARTAEAMGPHGLHTGDRGALLEGRLRVFGRRSDRIVTGGENVDPVRVASALRGHSGVADATVVGLEDPEWGERVAALVVPAPDAAPTPTELRERVRERVAPFARPRTIAFADQLPRTTSGTVDRDAVKARLRNADD